MRVLVVSGIWPPDVGGPASHAPELAEYLRGRGHGVEVVTTAAAAPEARGYRISYVSRRVPVGLRHVAVAALVARRARAADVIYATSMLGRSALGAAVARRPFVVKLTGDEAYERARRRGLFDGGLDAFQQHRGGLGVRLLRGVRNASLERAAHMFSPSEYLRRLAIDWGVAPERITTLPNPAPEAVGIGDRAELRHRHGFEGPTLAFAGRLTAAKAVDLGLEALAAVEDVQLAVAGDGPDRRALEARAQELGLDRRVRFLGVQPRERVLELFAAADAVMLSSKWENFPHTVVEALGVGTPVIATAVGGVSEVVRDGQNGLLVAPGDAAALAGAIRRFFAEPELRDRLAAAAAPSVAEYRPERVLRRIEAELASVADAP